jgi:hypothetical protein
MAAGVVGIPIIGADGGGEFGGGAVGVFIGPDVVGGAAYAENREGCQKEGWPASVGEEGGKEEEDVGGSQPYRDGKKSC